jgi:hypothetical protein
MGGSPSSFGAHGSAEADMKARAKLRERYTIKMREEGDGRELEEDIL